MWLGLLIAALAAYCTADWMAAARETRADPLNVDARLRRTNAAVSALLFVMLFAILILWNPA